MVYALAGFLLPVCAGFDAPQSPCIQGMRLLFFTVIDAAGRGLAFFAWFSSIDQLPEIQFFPFGAGGRKYHPLVWCEFNQYLLTAFVGFVFSMDKSNKKYRPVFLSEISAQKPQMHPQSLQSNTPDSVVLRPFQSLIPAHLWRRCEAHSRLSGLRR
ncbi:hypothetical protein [uncultured Oscillibacter sp.]|uniref:hypothetical protein n=1 Tax=uncultured Oscillibacter sp. TaxID=876091 RepID=UPI00261764B7|nr:hypothetical protein [uncultured Oscillibacter sp.]